MKELIKSGTINLGAGLNDVRRASLEWHLEKGEHGPVFTAQASLWHAGRGESGGQCLDELLAAYPDDERIRRIHAVWQEWHLNDLNAGTPDQEAAIEVWKDKGNKYDYTAACQMLKEAGLYAVPATPELKASALGGYDKDTYTYGARWLYRAIPEAVLAEIHSW